ncbi:MAG: oxidoreductase [Nannocystaceae bacterium]
MSTPWTQHDIPDQTGKVALVTGANSGIGLETARELARRGAHVILACRSRDRAEAALQDLEASLPGATFEFMALDLADLDQVRAFAEAFRARFDRLDLLINNAGVMVPPASTTKQGYELQLGVNHLGHFALTGLLLDRLLATPGARVVNVSSMAHRSGKMDFDDLDFRGRGYRPWQAYGQSKLANLLFTFELARRLEAAGAGLIVAAAHPGWTATNLQQNAGFVQRLNPIFAMPPLGGALPTLRAATDPSVRPGDYFGPKGLFQTRGAPVRVGTNRAAKSLGDAARLWEVSEERTGVRFPISTVASAA